MSQLPKTWEADIVTDYIKQESQQKSPEVFMETHLPITRIRAEILQGHDGDFVSQEGFLDHVLQSSADTAENRIYLLKGEVGSGKSHLCQWLEYQLNGHGTESAADDEHAAIHISRSNTRLNDILDKLYEHIDAEHDEITDIVDIDADKLADFIIRGLDTFDANKSKFENSGFDFETFLEDASKKVDLRQVLTENIREYQDAVVDEEKEQRIDLLTREEFGRICFNAFGNTHKDSDVFPMVRQAIHDRLLKNIDIEDFQGELQEIAELYREEGKRPVLICEDVTTFNVLKDDLLDHIFELGDGGEEMTSGFDIILGYTTGWESENADDALMTGDLSFMKTRAKGYLTMTNDDGEAYFLEEGAMPVQLVDKYLDVIRSNSDVTGAPEIDDDAFDGLYPFNERFIMRAYGHLEEDGKLQQTPRLLLYHVVADCLLSDVPPHEKVQNNTHLRDFSTPIAVGSLDASFQNLVKWYGRMDGGEVVIPAEIPETFDVPIPDDVKWRDGLICFDVVYQNIGWEIPESVLQPVNTDLKSGKQAGVETGTDGTSGESDGGSSSGGSTGATGDGKPVEKTPDEEESQRTKRLGQFQNWMGTGDEFESSNRLKEGVSTALNRFYDPTRVANQRSTADRAAGFYFAEGDDVPVTIIGPDRRKEVSIDVPFDGDEQMYYDLFMYGLDGEFPDGTNFEKIRSWCDDRVLEFRSRMRSDLEACLNGLSLEEFVVLAWYLILNSANGKAELERDIVFEEYEHVETSPFKWDESPFDLPQSLRSGFNDELTARRSDVQSLCRGFFLLKENFVDDDRLAPTVRAVAENLEDYLDAAARISVADLPDAYRIGTTRSSATTRASKLFETVSDYATELQKLHQNFDGEEIEAELEVVQDLHNYDHTSSKLLDVYNRLKESIAPLEDVSFQERWNSTETLLEENPDELKLDAFARTLRKFEDIESANGVEVMTAMHEFNEARSSQKAWEVYTTLGEMIETIESHRDAEDNDFQDLLTTRSEFEEFQTVRQSTRQTLQEI